MSQQYLPFTVLKQVKKAHTFAAYVAAVATVLTVYGIETEGSGFHGRPSLLSQQYLPFTVLKQSITFGFRSKYAIVATVLTVYGIETQSY